MWICHLKLKLSEDHISRMKPAGIINESFIKEFFLQTGSMISYSEEWSTCFVFRLILGVLTSWLAINYGRALLQDDETSEGIVLMVIGYAYYFLTWVTVACGAVVNNTIYKKTMLGLATLMYDGTPEDAQKDAFNTKRSMVIVRVNGVNGIAGLKIGTVFLNSSQIVKVGTLMLTILTTTVYLANGLLAKT